MKKEKAGRELAIEVVGGVRLNLVDYAKATDKPTKEVNNLLKCEFILQ